MYKAPASLWISRTIDVVGIGPKGDEVGRATVTVSSAKTWMIALGALWAFLSIFLLSTVLAIWPPPAAPAHISVYPLVVTLAANDSLQFLSYGTGPGDPAVIWTSSEGSITPSGVLTVPPKAVSKTIVVTATRNVDRTQIASAQIIIAENRLVMEQSVIDASSRKRGDLIDIYAAGPKGRETGLSWYLAGSGSLDAKKGGYTVGDKSASQAVITAVEYGTDRRASVVVQFSGAEISESQVLLLVVLMGAFGALLGAMRSFVNYVGSRTFVPSWSFYYLSRPMFGAGLALITFLAYRIGAVVGPKSASPADPAAAAFIAGIVGLFADTILQKLKELITQLFRPDDPRPDKLAAGVVTRSPAITKLSVNQGVLTITGSNFATGATVSINGTAIPSISGDMTKLIVALPAALASQGTKLDVIVANPDGTKSAAQSLQL